MTYSKHTQLLILQKKKKGGGWEVYGNQEGTFIYQSTMPSPTALKRSSVFGFMGMTCRQSGSFSRALFIQLTKAYFSSSTNKDWSDLHAIWKPDKDITHMDLTFSCPRVILQGYPSYHLITLDLLVLKNQGSLKKRALNLVIKIQLKI